MSHLHHSMLPSIKCSSCGLEVSLSDLGDHTCTTVTVAKHPPSSPTDPDHAQDHRPGSAPVVSAPSDTLSVPGLQIRPATRPTSPLQHEISLDQEVEAACLDSSPAETADETDPSNAAAAAPRSLRPKLSPIDSVAANGLGISTGPLTPASSTKLSGSPSPSLKSPSITVTLMQPFNSPASAMPPTPASAVRPTVNTNFRPPSTDIQPGQHDISPLSWTRGDDVTPVSPIHSESDAISPAPTPSPVLPQLGLFPPLRPHFSKSTPNLQEAMPLLVERKQPEEKKILGLFRRKSSKHISKKSISGPSLTKSTVSLESMPAVPALQHSHSLPVSPDEAGRIDRDGRLLPAGPAPPRPARPQTVILDQLKAKGVLPQGRPVSPEPQPQAPPLPVDSSERIELQRKLSDDPSESQTLAQPPPPLPPPPPPESPAQPVVSEFDFSDGKRESIFQRARSRSRSRSRSVVDADSAKQRSRSTSVADVEPAKRESIFQRARSRSRSRSNADPELSRTRSRSRSNAEPDHSRTRSRSQSTSQTGADPEASKHQSLLQRTKSVARSRSRSRSGSRPPAPRSAVEQMPPISRPMTAPHEGAASGQPSRPFHSPTNSGSSNDSQSMSDARTELSASTPATSTTSSFGQWKQPGEEPQIVSAMAIEVNSSVAQLPHGQTIRTANFSRPRAVTGSSSGSISHPRGILRTSSSMDMNSTRESSGSTNTSAQSSAITSPADEMPGQGYAEAGMSGWVRPPLPPIPDELEARNRTRKQSVSRTRSLTNKGNCRGCGQAIQGKSVKASDGRLTGRYHRDCFVCKTCCEPFPTADFYVINDEPYCHTHYHVLNGSTCFHCKKGIEGEYLAIFPNRKFHHICFACHDCGKPLSNNDYYEMAGHFYCQEDAERAWHGSRQLPPARTLGAERRMVNLVQA